MMKTPSTLTFSIACNASSGMSSAGPIQAMPALLTSRSICLKRARTVSTARPTSSSDVTSAATARPPISAATACAAEPSQWRAATDIPSPASRPASSRPIPPPRPASRRAISRPIPPQAPVTSPTRPFSGYMPTRSSHPQPLGSNAGACGQRFALGPDDVFGDAAHSGRGVEPAIGAGDDAVRIADRRRDAFETVGHGLGVLDEICQTVDDAGDDDLVFGKRELLEDAVFMRVPRIGKGEEEPADIGLLDDRQDIGERHVAIVRPLVIAPTDMQPHTVAPDIFDGLVDCRDDPLDKPEEVAERPILVGEVAFERQIGAIELQ